MKIKDPTKGDSGKWVNDHRGELGFFFFLIYLSSFYLILFFFFFSFSFFFFSLRMPNHSPIWSHTGG